MTKSGYIMTVAPGSGSTAIGTASGTCNASAGVPQSAYFAKANPVSLNGTGTRYFATDTRGTIFRDRAASIANPIPATGTPVQ